MKRPNVLWIQTDEQRPDSLSCYGAPWAYTPSAGRLAVRGTTFHECHVQSPVCVPSRTSMLMCRYPHELGVIFNDKAHQDGVIDPREHSFVNCFAEAGYRTASIGKWHTPNHPTWQENVAFEYFGDKADYYTVYPPYSAAGQRVVNRKGRNPIILGGIYPFHDWGLTPASHVTDLAIEWLRKASTVDQPFLLRVSHLWPHTPVLVPKPWDSLYAPEELPFRPFNRQAYESRSAFDRDFSDTQQCAHLSEKEWRRIKADYYGLCAYVDHEIGRLLRVVDELGLAEHTIIAFNSDHGKSLGEIGLSEKGNFDRQVWRVPFILAGPGVPKDEHRHDLMELIDFGSTLASLAGVDLSPGMRGRDLFSSEEPEAVFGILELDGQLRAAVRTARYRYDCTLSRGGMNTRPHERDPNLIDLQNDPLEENNLIHTPQYAPVASEMHQRLEEWWAISSPAQ